MSISVRARAAVVSDASHAQRTERPSCPCARHLLSTALRHPRSHSLALECMKVPSSAAARAPPRPSFTRSRADCPVRGLSAPPRAGRDGIRADGDDIGMPAWWSLGTASLSCTGAPPKRARMGPPSPPDGRCFAVAFPLAPHRVCALAQKGISRVHIMTWMNSVRAANWRRAVAVLQRASAHVPIATLNQAQSLAASVEVKTLGKLVAAFVSNSLGSPTTLQLVCRCCVRAALERRTYRAHAQLRCRATCDDGVPYRPSEKTPVSGLMDHRRPKAVLDHFDRQHQLKFRAEDVRALLEHLTHLRSPQRLAAFVPARE